LSDEKEGIVVASPVEGSPAEEAGIESGDVLVAVDGKEVGEKKAAEIVGDVKGKKGTMVELTVRRDGKERDFEMQRAEIKSPIASWYLIPDSETAHVRLTSFSDDSAEELSRVLDEARAGGAKRFILDVRDNPGGRLDQAEKISSEFLETGKVIYIREDADGDREEIKVKDGAERVKAPLVVLVNQGSASSSEILAGALRDNDRAEVIGKTTFGTGTVLSEFTLSDDSSILLGVAEWLTPDGDFIRESGIDPDIEVKLGKDSDPVTPNEAKDMSADEILEGDAQLRRAFEEVSQK
jgi:carboxyl-terminal processing protease